MGSVQTNNDFSALEKFFSAVESKSLNILILTHKGADVDAIASAGIFYFMFIKNHSVKIIVPEHINMAAKSFAEKLKIPFSVDERISNKDMELFDYIFILDCSEKNMLGNYANFLDKENVFVIDHHQSKIKKNNFIIADSISTTLLIYKITEHYGLDINKDIAVCVASGIISDSSNLYLARSEDLYYLAKMLDLSNKSYYEICSLFEIPRTIAEKVATLKAVKRCRIFNSLGYLIVTTEVDAYEANAASLLVQFGADVAFAAGVKKGILLISARVKQDFLKKTGFDLSKNIFYELSRRIGGSGGGHAGAASFNSSSSMSSAALDLCVKLTHQFIENYESKKVPIREY
ncbi:MAG: DHH family phosphoesterase [Candidatus Diapherotrites archaeon]|nr:DHH family phosphoesterase [Candidatus Diapherotrites archaeon]